jgi:hypothetical protein
MISWTISVEPVTSITASTWEYLSGGLNVGIAQNDSVTSALEVRVDNKTFETRKWSETVREEIGLKLSLSATTVRGSTNSTSTVGTFNSAQQTGSTRRTVTILGSVASVTSTTLTTQRTITETTSTTQVFFKYSTSSSNTTATTVISTDTRSTIRTTFSTRVETIDATTADGSHLNNAAAATVYQANTRHASSADVIWIASQSLVSDQIATAAASNAATSTTRTTIWPNDETTSYSIVDKSITATSAHTNQSITQALNFVRSQNIPTETTEVVTQSALPQMTNTRLGNKRTTTASNTTTSVFEQNQFTAAYTKSSTQTGATIQKVSDTFYGIACDRTYTAPTSRTIKAVDGAWTTSSIGSESETAPTSTYRITAPSAFDTTATATGNPILTIDQEDVGVTALITLRGQATTTIGSPISRLVELKAGVLAPEGTVAGYFSAMNLEQTLFAGSAYASVSRKVLTARPGTFLVSSSSGDSESQEFVKIGTASLSELLGSATTTTTTNEVPSTTKSSFTFSLQAQGDVVISRTDTTQNLASCGGSVGLFETLLVTTPSGVYRSLNGSTAFKSEQVASYQSGNSLERLEPVTYFQTTTDQSMSVILWTSPRNSTAPPSV